MISERDGSEDIRGCEGCLEVEAFEKALYAMFGKNGIIGSYWIEVKEETVEEVI